MLYHLSSIVFDILSTDIYIICYFQQVFSKMNMPHYTKSNRIISINSIKIMSTNKCIKKSKIRWGVGTTNWGCVTTCVTKIIWRGLTLLMSFPPLEQLKGIVSGLIMTNLFSLYLAKLHHNVYHLLFLLRKTMICIAIIIPTDMAYNCILIINNDWIADQAFLFWAKEW